MVAGNGNRGLAGVFGLSGHPIQQQWAAGDGFGVFLRLSQPDKQGPPVVNQRHKAAY